MCSVYTVYRRLNAQPAVGCKINIFLIIRIVQISGNFHHLVRAVTKSIKQTTPPQSQTFSFFAKIEIKENEVRTS